MNQKQSEDFDEYIKKLAADADSPFHEQSWHEMEYLLNICPIILALRPFDHRNHIIGHH